MGSRARALGVVRAAVVDADTMRWWTWLAVGGPPLAFALALAGGLPFDLPMPTHLVGLVEPTCGLTRGSTAVARGDLALGWRYNPAVFVLVGIAVTGLGRTLVGLLTGRWLAVAVRPGAAGWVLAGGLLLVLWWHQQSNAAFIINARR